MFGTPLCLLLACLPVWAGSALQPHQGALSGRAIVITADFTDMDSQRLLAISLADGRRVQVEVSDPGVVDGLRTGMAIHVTGEWEEEAVEQQEEPLDEGEGMSDGSTEGAGATAQGASAAPGGDGGARALGAAGVASAAGPAKSGRKLRRFRATKLRAFAGPKVPAKLTRVPSRRSSSGGVSAANADQPDLIVLSTNPLVSSDLSTLVVPIGAFEPSGAVCPGTQRPPLTAEQLRGVVFQELARDGAPSVGGTYNTCSYGKTQMTMNNSRVAEVVRLPCAGTTPNGVPYSFSTCNYADFMGYADAADELLRGRGVAVEQYRHKVYMVPPGACGWVGLGFIGCAEGSIDCRSWVGGEFWDAPQAMIHEIGHNLYLEHAGALDAEGFFDEYADIGGVMGYCCASRCFNTPHAWQMGWISVQQLDGAALRPGQPLDASLASQAMSQRSGMRIVPTWSPVGVDPLFLGYRTASRGDVELDPEFVGAVSIWTSPINATTDAMFTTLQESLDGGEVWEYVDAGLIVRVNTVGATSATVSVCRYDTPETAAACSAAFAPLRPATPPLLRRQPRRLLA